MGVIKLNRYFKAMLSMMLVFILGFFSIEVSAKTCIEIPGDIVGSHEC